MGDDRLALPGQQQLDHALLPRLQPPGRLPEEFAKRWRGGADPVVAHDRLLEGPPARPAELRKDDAPLPPPPAGGVQRPGACQLLEVGDPGIAIEPAGRAGVSRSERRHAPLSGLAPRQASQMIEHERQGIVGHAGVANPPLAEDRLNHAPQPRQHIADEPLERFLVAVGLPVDDLLGNGSRWVCLRPPDPPAGVVGASPCSRHSRLPFAAARHRPAEALPQSLLPGRQ